jgi:hypothetical protein
MLREIERPARGDAFEFLRAERELEEDVDAGPCIVRQFF